MVGRRPFFAKSLEQLLGLVVCAGRLVFCGLQSLRLRNCGEGLGDQGLSVAAYHLVRIDTSAVEPGPGGRSRAGLQIMNSPGSPSREEGRQEEAFAARREANIS